MKKAARLFNIIGIVVFVIVLMVINYTNIGLIFKHPICKTSDVCDVVWFVILPVFLIVDLVIHILANIHESKSRQIKLVIKQIIISFLIFTEITIVSLALSSNSQVLFSIKDEDNSVKYVAKYKMFLNSASFSLYSGFFENKPITNSESISGLVDSYEIGWIDENNFNIKISDEKEKHNSIYSFIAPDELKTISLEEFISQKYIKTNKYYYN